MWWQCIPSGAIIGLAFAIPGITTYAVNMYLTDSPYRRVLMTVDDKHHYLRDRRLTNRSDPYTQVGLENLEEYCNPPVKKEEECECPPKKGTS